MTTTTTDPLAGIPVATASKPARAKVRPAPTAPATGGKIINLAQAKKKRLTGAEYKQARDFARGVTGYNDTSPIWGKKMPEVLVAIETLLDAAHTALTATTPVNTSAAAIAEALVLNRELQKRIATGQLIGAQS